MGSEKEALKAELQRREARLQAVLKSSLDAIISMDDQGRIVEFNPAAERIFGYSRAEVLNKVLGGMIVPERLRERHRQGLAHYLATGSGPVVGRRIELPALRKNGEEFPVELAIVPVEGSDPVLFKGFLRDITERKAAEQRQQFLGDELAHRCKNMLAVIQSIVVTTLPKTELFEETREVLLRRIGALAKSQTALAARGPQGAPLAEIIRLEFEAFSDRVKASGPELLLTPKAAQTFALLVHELATNAVKHGALSAPAGCVLIGWRTISDGQQARFEFRWEEQNGPSVAAPTRKGFGRTLLEDAVAQDFGQAPTITFAADGLIYEIECALDVVRQPPTPDVWFTF